MKKSKLSIIIILINFITIISYFEYSYCIAYTHVKHLFDIRHEFNNPSDVSVSSVGNIYIVDGVNSQVKIFNNSGKYIGFFGGPGSEKGQFEMPLGIDIDDNGAVYIADSGNHRIQTFKSDGSFLYSINIPASSESPSDPTDIAVVKNNIFVVDNDNNKVFVYDKKTRKLLNQFGTTGAQELQFNHPFLIADDGISSLFISDVINTRIQAISTTGKFLNLVGQWGVEKGQLYRPKGVAIDAEKRIFVSDSYMGVIQIFDKSGNFLSVIADKSENATKKFKTPTGIFVDKTGRLLVVEMLMNKVSVYKIM
ncbi:MAG: NHL repeat-containing protein [Pseudomonadota bacterium]